MVLPRQTCRAEETGSPAPQSAGETRGCMPKISPRLAVHSSEISQTQPSTQMCGKPKQRSDTVRF
ncbi:hypothetical protein JOB18_016522 [Solea senegalensis]|uniref:Uncharacterized protein n=1 Tax=Solea senegalensis TaxID=28829 RepID=A0AAV6SDH2_SOLSE|nr:hypothetical protein JOB18_016522 [Solea senegalensis]